MRIILLIGTVDLLLSLLGFFYYRYQLPFGKTTAFSVAYLVLTLNAILSRAVSPALPHWLMKISAWAEGLWLAFSYYTLLLALLHLLAYLAAKLCNLQLPKTLAVIALACACCAVAWGSWRAFHPVIRTEKIVTNKLPANTHYQAVLLTDVHLGRILGRSYAEGLVVKVTALNPDFVLIAGDLVDEKIAYVQAEDSLSAFKALRAPQGVYLAYGNHEYIDNPKLWQEMATDAGITVLRDKAVTIANQVKVVGLNDYSRSRDTIALQQLAVNNEDYYSILLDHQPRKMATAQAAGYDLYLSGHTHTGQLFPNRQITKRMYALDYGRMDLDGFNAITSAGYGFWGPPVRTEARPDIVVIEITGK